MSASDSRDAACGPVQDWTYDDHCLELRLQAGVMRIEATAEDILRVRFAPSGAFAPRRSWDVVQTPPPARLAVQPGEAAVRAATAGLRVEVQRDSGAVHGYDRDGRPLAHDLSGPRWRPLSIADAPGLAGASDGGLPAGPARLGVFLDKRMRADEGYYGFGQRTGKLDRRHRAVTNWTVDRSSPGHSRGNDNMYQVHPMFMAVRPDLAWGLFLHSTWYSAFDVGTQREEVLGLSTLGGELDYYLFAGPTPAAVLEQLTRITGRPALPPLWAMGYHQSRWSYASDAEVQAVAAGFRDRGIPLDAIHLDIDYMYGFRVFTWDPERFPDPAATLARLHGRGVRAVAIVDPGVKQEVGTGYTVAEEGAREGHFVHNPDGTPFSGYVWPGESRFPDFCRAATRRWWGGLHASLVAAGVDGIWCDMNEPAIVDRPFRTPGVTDKPIPLAAEQGEDGERALHAEVHNLYGHLMAQSAAEALRRLRPGRRPWVLTRSAYMGIQRYAATWMGDNSSWWEHLEMSLPQLASMGLCGSPHVGVDIGGFYHNAFGELFARWMEVGSFYPFMRCHTRYGSHAQEPWSFGPEVEAVARRAIELRYRLLPYLYTLAQLAARTGAPLLRPLVYDFPQCPAFYHVEDQLMVGPQLMVAPICGPGLRRRLVELPPGRWYDFWSGAELGLGPLVWPAPPGRVPLFVRGGSILTLGNLRQSTAEPVSVLTLAVYPGDGEWTLIEDDGESLNGSCAETHMTVACRRGTVAFTMDARRGPYRPPPRELALHLHLPHPPSRVLKDGATIDDWVFDPAQQRLVLAWPDDGQGHRIEVQLRRRRSDVVG